MLAFRQKFPIYLAPTGILVRISDQQNCYKVAKIFLINKGNDELY